MISVNSAERSETVAHNSKEGHKNIVDDVDEVFVLITTTDPACASLTTAFFERVLHCLPIKKSTQTRPNMVIRNA